PPPPRLPAEGHTTASARPTATAASTAFPPRFNTSTPTCEAISLTEETIPCLPRTGGREAARVEGDMLSCEGVAVNDTSNAKQRRAETVFLVFISLFGGSISVSRCVIAHHFPFAILHFPFFIGGTPRHFGDEKWKM